MHCIAPGCSKDSPGRYQLVHGLTAYLCYDCAKSYTLVLKRGKHPVLAEHFMKQTAMDCIKELLEASIK